MMTARPAAEPAQAAEIRCQDCNQLIGRRVGPALTLFGVTPRPERRDPRFVRVQCPSCHKRIRLAA